MNTNQDRVGPAAVCFAVLLLSWPASAVTPTPEHSSPRDETLASAEWWALVEEDWLQQAAALRAARVPLTTHTDAAGACDGVKDGRYGFHTGADANPWWQVDLGAASELDRIVVYNRLDYAPGLHNADTLRILTAEVPGAWTLRHDNQGRHFGGVSGGGPLEVRFSEGTVRARYVRLEVPSTQPLFFHLDEVEVYSRAEPDRNLALHQLADQSSLSEWSVVKRRPGDDPGPLFPTADVLERGRRLARAMAQGGLDVTEGEFALDRVERALHTLGSTPTPDAAQAVYLEARRTVRRLLFGHPLLNFDRLLFVKRFTQETYPDVCLNHMPWVSRPGGDLCVLSSGASGGLFPALARPGADLTVRSVLNGALGPGHVHGMDLWWDGDRAVFGYAKAKSDSPPEGWLDRARSYHLRRTEEPIHLFEVALDGRWLRQLTDGEWSDLDPTYAPNGDIVFVSERCGTSLQCNEYDKDETSCNLYVMKPDGQGIRRLSVNKDGDYLPHTLDDGMIAYTRWEYHERSWAYLQSLWVVRPDGTAADAIFKQHFVDPWALEDVRSIPASRKLVAIATGHHTLAVGPLVVVDVSLGINEPRGIQILTPGVKPPEGGMDGVIVPGGGVPDGGGFYSTPWALSEQLFLVAYNYGKQTEPAGYALYLIDVFGNKELVYRDPHISSFIPIPLRPRPRPPILPESIDLAADHATCILSDASFGSEELAGRIRYLRIAEPIGWPYDNELGGQRYGEKGVHLVNWTPVRILGDVPVLPDGSAHFRVPPDTAVYFQLLDEERRELRRMRSFISFQPGEQRACAGCHETRGIAPRAGSPPLAASRPPPEPLLPPWGDRPVSFLRDIQPLLDRHCRECHAGLKPAGGLDLAGGLTDWSYKHEKEWGLVAGYGFNRAFESLRATGVIATAEPNLQDASITPSLAYGALRSRLLATLEAEPHAARVQLTPSERLALTMWIDANAPYHDRFVNKRTNTPPYDLPADRDLAKTLTDVHERRCAECHSVTAISRLDWIDLHEPERSRFLAAPLAREAGGSGRCAEPVYRDSADPDYAALRERVRAAVDQAWARPRRDLPALIEDAQGVPPSRPGLRVVEAQSAPSRSRGGH